MPEIIEPTQLIVVLEVCAGAGERLQAALTAAKISSVVIAPAAGGTLDAASAGPLVIAAQKAGVAALIADDARLARTLKADGVHVSVTDQVIAEARAAREVVGARAIVGADVGRSRDDAMMIGEDGAEYVGFGIPPFVKERDVAVERRLDLVEWWSEIFQVPCVAFDVDTREEAGDLAAVGADFVAIRLGAAQSPADVQQRLRDFETELRDVAAARDMPPSDEGAG